MLAAEAPAGTGPAALATRGAGHGTKWDHRTNRLRVVSRTGPRQGTNESPPHTRGPRNRGGVELTDAYVYSRASETEAMQAKVLTADKARRIAHQYRAGA
jgi:hypothetical protein